MKCTIVFVLITSLALSRSICGRQSCNSCVAASEYVPHWSGSDVYLIMRCQE